MFFYLSFKVRNGHIKRITDNDIQSLVLEIVGTNVRYVNIGYKILINNILQSYLPLKTNIIFLY